MSWHLLLELEIVVIVSCCAFGIAKGAAAERLGSLLILFFYMVDVFAFKANRSIFPVYAIFVGDFVLATGLLVIALRYSSLWLGCAMLLQSIDLCSQGLALSGDGLSVQGQLWLNNGVSMTMMACVVVGASVSSRRRVKAQKAQGRPQAAARHPARIV
jgi:hypothetical protein